MISQLPPPSHLNQKSEEFRAIPEWQGYRVSAAGRVQTCRSRGYGRNLKDEWKDLTPRMTERGYLSVGLKCYPRRTFMPVHVLVLLAWVGPRPEGMEGCHNNGIKTDNRVENLRWDSRSENAKDIKRYGGKYGFQGHQPTGEKNGAAKLTMEKAREIRRKYAACEGTQRELASEFGVTQRAVWQLLRGITWPEPAKPE